MKTLFEYVNEATIDELEKAKTRAWLDKMNINNYTINKDGTVDVKRSVDIFGRRLTEIPVKFNKVGGDFYCDNNKLTSLEGAPEKVGGGFYCDNNKLTSLEGAPKEVGGSFWCNNNKLTSLEGAPEIVSGNFHCQNNDLTSLDGAPQTVSGNFHCHNNKVQFTEEDVRKVSNVKGEIVV